MIRSFENNPAGILAIDPGPTLSAFVLLVNGNLVSFGKWENDQVRDLLKSEKIPAGRIVIEEIRSYGMPVGIETFNTVRWVGRFQEIGESRGVPVALMPRQQVKLHICKSPKANDAAIRQALLDRFGPGKDRAVGTKKQPGPLFGLKADIWQALALGLTFQETAA